MTRLKRERHEQTRELVPTSIVEGDWIEEEYGGRSRHPGQQGAHTSRHWAEAIKALANSRAGLILVCVPVGVFLLALGTFGFSDRAAFAAMLITLAKTSLNGVQWIIGLLILAVAGLVASLWHKRLILPSRIANAEIAHQDAATKLLDQQAELVKQEAANKKLILAHGNGFLAYRETEDGPVKVEVLPSEHNAHYWNEAQLRALPGGQKPLDTPPLPAPYDFSQELLTWRPSASGIFLGRAATSPILMPMNQLWHIALTGPTGGGKTVIMRIILPQLLYTGAICYLCDIHFAPIKHDTSGAPIDWRPIAERLAHPPIRDINDIVSLAEQLARKELQARIDREYRGEPIGAPLYLGIEEVPAIVDEKPEIAGHLAKLLRQGRQYGLCFIGATQDLLVKTIGTSSGVRECFRTGYYTGGDATTARIILNLQKGQTIDEDGLGVQGRVYLKTATMQAQEVRVPYASNESIYALLGRPGDVPMMEPLQPTSAFSRSAWTEPEKPFDGYSGDGSAFVIEADEPADQPPLGDQPSNVRDFPQSRESSPVEPLDASPKEYRLSEGEINAFIAAYRACGSIDKALSAIGRGGWYKKHASGIVRAHNLRKEA